MWVEPVGKKREEKDYSSWFQYQEDDLAVEFIAVNRSITLCATPYFLFSEQKRATCSAPVWVLN